MITRRTLAHGVAWSVPALTLVAVAPAYAASGCPDISIVESYVNASQDRITVTNTSPTLQLPLNTTITWRVTNLAASTETITIGTRSAGLGASTPASATLAQNASASFVMKLTSAIAANGGSVNWLYSATQWNMRGTVTISFAGTTLAQCPDIVGCVSVLGATTGTTCPAKAAALAARSTTAASSTDGIDYPRV